MTIFVLILFISCLPVARAITVSRDSGARGVLGFAVWGLEATAREATILAGALRRFHSARVEMRARWTAQEAR